MIGRRELLVAGLGLPLLSAARAPDLARTLLDRAIAHAGGRAALSAARVLRWTGTASVFAGKRRIEIGVDTRVEPFVRARSDSWPLEQGRRDLRSIVIEPGDAWLERRGTRMPIPDAMATHERQQFAIYGLMRLVDLEASMVRMIRHGDTLNVRHPRAPETLLRFDPAARLTGAENVVASHEHGSPIRQRFTFEGRMPGPIAWPRRISIEQDGAPYFALVLDSFNTGST